MTDTGSCFPDLIGARFLPGLELRIRDALPRYRLRRAYKAVGLPNVPVRQASDEELRRAGAVRVAAAATAALAAAPDLRGLAWPESAARRAVGVLASSAGINTGEMAFALGMTRIAAARLGKRVADPRILAATRRRIVLENAARMADERHVTGEKRQAG